MATVDNTLTTQEQRTLETENSKWSTVRQHIGSKTLRRIRFRPNTKEKIETEIASRNPKSIENDSESKDFIMEFINDPEVLRRLSLEPDSETQLALEELKKEMMATFTEMSSRKRTDSMKKLRGIIKKTMNCDCNTKLDKSKNSVHFSEENIYFEIPRRRQHKFNVAREKCTYYCCFGFLFPV